MSRATAATGGPAALRLPHYLLVAAVALVLLLPGFFTIPPFDRDESRYAQASHQMLETGDFVDIRFQEEPRHKKPVGIYWMQSAAVALLSDDGHGAIWMYRLPSLLGAVAAALLTAWAGARLFGPAAGLAGGLALAAALVLGVEARMAKTDAALLATVAAAQGVLAQFYLARGRPGMHPGTGLALAFWAALGVGILVKGPIILMVTGGTILALGAADRDLRWLKPLRPALGVPLLLAIVLPWLVAIGIATEWEFFRYAIGHEFLGKAHSVQESHSGPPGYYLATFWLSFWPWSLPAVLALPWAWAKRREPAVRFCLAWVLPSWVIFEAVSTKLPHYTIIVFPAIALLAAASLLDRAGADGTAGAATGKGARWFRGGAAGFYLLVTAAFAGGAVWFPYDLEGRIEPLAMAAAAAILGTGIAVAVFAARRQAERLLAAGLIGAAATYGLAHGAVLPRIEPMWLSPKVAAAVEKHRPCPGSVLAAAGYTEPSMVFLVGTGTVLGAGDRVAQHLLADPACALGLVTGEVEERRFREALGGAEPRLLEEIPGFNYSRGKRVVLRLYTLAPAAVAPDQPRQQP